VEPPIADQILSDRAKNKAVAELASVRGKYEEALKTIERLEGANEALVGMTANIDSATIKPLFKGDGTSEATVMVVASDWHGEERVDPRRINGLNEANLDIITGRIKQFFQGALRLTRLLQQDVRIDNMLMALLGDFISGDIHEEVAEVCQLPPMEAAMFVCNLMIGGFDMLLDHSKLTFTIPCHVGNHGRTTKTSRFSTENGHSIEYLMYQLLASHYRSEPRMKFLIAGGMMSYIDVYDLSLRFLHGHAIKFGGGVGGITIPVLKALAQWDKAKHADVTVFGHFHQSLLHRQFICNSSLIGYNAFALSIKADYEPPSQTLTLFDKKRGRTCTWPILLGPK
jgi:hypothetical protein